MAKLNGTHNRADFSRRRWLTGCLMLLGGPFGPGVKPHRQSAAAAQGTERIDSVTAEGVRELAAKLVSGAQPSVAVVGAGRKGQGFARMAAERVAKA